MCLHAQALRRLPGARAEELLQERFGRAGRMGPLPDSSRTRASRIDRFLVTVLREGVFLFDLKGRMIWSRLTLFP